MDKRIMTKAEKLAECIKKMTDDTDKLCEFSFSEEGTHDICRYSLAFSIEKECLTNGIY